MNHARNTVLASNGQSNDLLKIISVQLQLLEMKADERQKTASSVPRSLLSYDILLFINHIVTLLHHIISQGNGKRKAKQTCLELLGQLRSQHLACTSNPYIV